MKLIEIGIDCHAPLRIATGRARNGLDAVLDHERIPASSLKGVMRAAARDILQLNSDTVDEVFGSPGKSTAWAWSDAVLPGTSDQAITTRVRIPIDSDSGVAAPGGMFHAEELWLRRTVTFTIEQTSPCDCAQRQSLLLAASAMAVKSMGASRRRGMGWTTWRPTIDGSSVSAALLAAEVLKAREADA